MAQSKARLRASIPVWWLASFALHALVIAYLALLSPVRVIDPSKKKADASLSPAHASRIMGKISEKQAENLATSVRDLQAMQDQLASLEAAKLKEFEAFSRDQAKDAPTEAEAAQAAAEQAQAEALDLQTRADATLAQARINRSETELAKLDALQASASKAQARASESQERALEKLAISDTRYTEAYKAQSEASDAQEKAVAAQAAAQAASDAIKPPSTPQNNGAKIAAAESNIQRFETESIKTSAEISALTSLLSKTTSQDPNPATQKNNSREAATFQKKISQRQNLQAKTASRLTAEKNRLAQLKGQSAKNDSQTPPPSHEAIAALQTEARLHQLEAAKKQEYARAQFASAKTQAEPTHTGLASLDTSSDASPASSRHTASQPEKLSLPELYETALQSEAALAESYRLLRATELAMIRKIPLSRALEYTESVKVQRPNLTPALNNTADPEAAREAIQNARAEIIAIHSLGSSLLSQARSLDRSGSHSQFGTNISTENLQNEISREETLQALAAEDENARAKDLSAAMRHASKSHKSGGIGGGGSDGSGGGGGGGGGGSGNGIGSGGGGGGSHHGSGNGTGSGGGGTGGGARGGGGNGSGASHGFPGFGGGSSAMPTSLAGSVPAMPGRTVATRGESPRWMFVDSWYILGPFDNPGRANIDKIFPPETIVDRSATYTGKAGRTIKWEFHQAHEPKITPPFRSLNATSKRDQQYIIYFAATELFFEEDCDLWVALGSDDFSKVWINDQLIWASGKQTKPWRADEGFRKVHFSKGVNRVLYRVENGHGPTEFSFVIGMP